MSQQGQGRARGRARARGPPPAAAPTPASRAPSAVSTSSSEGPSVPIGRALARQKPSGAGDLTQQVGRMAVAGTEKAILYYLARAALALAFPPWKSFA